MALIGVRELRENTTEVLRRVREEKVEYIITHRGHPTALLLPIDADAAEQAMLRSGKAGSGGGWEAYARLAARLRAIWPEQARSEDLLDEQRR